MGKAKQRVFVEIDVDWIQEKLSYAVQRGLRGLEDSIERAVASEVDQAMRSETEKLLRAAARKSLKEQLGKVK